MKHKFHGGIAILLSFILVIMNLNPVITVGDQEVSIDISPVMIAEAAEDTPTPTPPNSIDTQLGFKIVYGSTNYTNKRIELSPGEEIKLMVTGEDLVTIANIEKVEWKSSKTSIATIEREDSNNLASRVGVLHAKNPGFTPIWVTVTYNGLTYDVMCEIWVKLEIDQAQGVNPSYANVNKENAFGAEWRGMKEGAIFTDDDYSITLQLSTPDANDTYNGVVGKNTYNGAVGDLFSHYLVRIKGVTYKKGVDETTTVADIANLENPQNGTVYEDYEEPGVLSWFSDNQSVCTVDGNGIITAVGAGMATITVSTMTSSTVDQKKDSQSFTVLVPPTAIVVPPSNIDEDGKHAPYQLHIPSVVVPNKTFTIHTNAKNASNLVWTIHKVNEKGEVIKQDKNDYMTINISDYSGAVTISNAKAGVYFITAMPNKKYPEGLSTISYLKIKVIVPIFVNLNQIFMNVGDTYNILENSNVLNKSILNFIENGGWNILEPDASLGSSVIKAKAAGKTNVLITYSAGADIYDTLNAEEKKELSGYGLNILTEDEKEMLSEEERARLKNTLPVQVIDGISLSSTSATMYVGHELQLKANSSNQSVDIKWSSSNEKIAKVSEDGLVTAIAVGDVTITATQVINGITKTATCQLKVLQTITEITLSPNNTSLAIGEYLTISASVNPTSTSASLRWVSSDNNVVAITSSTGLSATVQAKAGGIAVITAINQDNVVVGSCMIKVHDVITSITLSETDVTTSLAAKSFQLYATVLPAAAKDQEVAWRSTDTSIITVDQNGVVKLVKSGSAAIVATAKDNASIMAICKVTVTKAATGIKLDSTQKNMYVGETFRLSYTVTPSDASNTSVTWQSTNTSIATVDSTGLVSAKAVGTTTIILKTIDGGFMSLCTINVSRTASAVKLDLTKLMLNVGDSYLFEATITPADATETALSWESSDTSVAIVSKRGKVTAKKSGTCIILVKTKTGSTAYCTIVVYQGTTGIEINSDGEIISVGDTLELEAYVVPASSTNQTITWSSNKPTVAFVNNKGEVKGLQGGVAIITATASDGGYIANCVVTVEELVTKIELNPTSYKLSIGRTIKLETTVDGVNATNKQVSYTSSNISIATVDANGNVKGVRAGKADIVCRATDGSGAEALCEIEVVQPVTEITLNESYITLIQGKSYTLKSSLTPKNATYNTPIYTSSDDKIAVVSNKGVITALKPGDIVITVSTDDNSGVSALCYVHVIAPVASTGVTPQETEVVMAPGETKTVAISIKPNNSTDTYSWSSDNNLVASVDEKTGKITAHSLGTANITVMTDSGRKATIKVYVVGLSRTYVELQQYTTLSIKLEVDGSGDAALKVRWDVDNQEIATVSNGTITARALGTTTVYAVVNGRRLACTVKVVKIK